MRRISILVAVLALAAPAAARAGELTEAPFAPVGAHRIATCLRATGAPGELVLTGRRSVELWTATRAGAVRTGRLRLPSRAGCAVAASDAGGAAVVAVAAHAGRTQRLLVAVRAPGARFGAPVQVARSPEIDRLAVAVNARGDAVVAWLDAIRPAIGRDRERVRAVRSVAGGRPGAPRVLQRWARDRTAEHPDVAAAIDAAGTPEIAFRLARRGAPVLLASGRSTSVVPATAHGIGMALAVAPDGRMLVASGDGGGPVLAERPPGGGRFAVTRIDTRVPSFAGEISAALGSGGAAVLAWRDEDDEQSPVYAATRPAAGAPFTPARTLWYRSTRDWGGAVFETSDPGAPSATPRALLAPGGRAAVAWIAQGHLATARAWLAAGTTADGLGSPQPFGSPVREADGAAPVNLAGGAIALAWADDARGDALVGVSSPPGRLHVAAPGAVLAPDPPAPRISVRVPPRLRLYSTQGFTARVRCAAACDLLVRGAGGFVGRTLPARRWSSVPVGRQFLGVPPGRVLVTATAAAPGGSRTSTAEAETVVSRRRPPPVPHVLAVHARRLGHRVVVTWRTDRPARRALFLVHGLATRRERSLIAARSRFGRGRLSHRAVLRPADELGARPLATARWVALDTAVVDRTAAPARTLVPIR